MEDGDLYLSIGGQLITGWTDMRVTRGIERCPSDFDLGLTERFPGSANEVVVSPGDECQIQIGTDLVLTGYVDRYVPSYGPAEHAIRVSGRGKCQDLVDCSAVWPNGQISGTSAVDVATKLAAHYGITVNCDVQDLVKIPQFNVFIGETPFEIIERISRYSALLVYDQPDGNLRLARAEGQVKAASGIEEGLNVQTASIEYSAQDRFSEYVCFAQSVLSYTDAGIGPNAIARATDPVVKRTRERYIVAEFVQGFMDLVQRRATWEMQRRAGRSSGVVNVTVDSWRDSAGTLWTPNTLVDVSLPHLKLEQETWLIGEVIYRRTLEGGTTAELTVMDPRAYQPEPIALMPAFADGSTLGTGQ
ncbi:phage baseplate assembly protein [Paraburkholderia caballeronis]|uniref:Mu-like prophage tail protein gpP n=1 Tax=Paraburkholderia caballeronis TaxID=416943 RepID=A0A1H7TZZ6_9BURK|nr:Mu P family protein [Paraburkholderia caballeronis]PXW23413.1 prophage tail gpP-like protein [Paraburkholderia caballeronis]PXW98406.1 prophage tail gpP-like protein [Paraburkholderia caballeronis]RAJ95137.1 prophage tail gpP-like protein [Paraburkholderia caballeronis]SEC54954.1 Mu-like prophage tail protein gpP [Paraburkholderia caballeronis]SEL89986.1 Mu-like prophage tail protein gpP [Paraburkholderia caballeronis]